MTPKIPVPARLWVYLARNAPIGVILRRGPKEWVQMIHWDTKNDVFTPGHWMKAGIAEQSSHLSPDGQLFIYGVSKGYHPNKSEYGTGWTAVSQPPYFTALALWPYYTDGGFFVDNRTVYVTSWAAHPDHEPQGLQCVVTNVTAENCWFEINGWIKLRNLLIPDNQGYLRISKIETWQKDVDNFDFSLITRNGRTDIVQGGRPAEKQPDDNQEYAVINHYTNRESTLKDVVWADFDQQKRLVLAKAGKLFSAAVVDGELALTELADFNANQPEAIESPAWAKRW